MTISIENIKEHAAEAMRSCHVDYLGGRYTMAAIDRGIAIAYESMLIDSGLSIDELPAEYHEMCFEWFQHLGELKERDVKTFKECTLIEGSENM